MRVLGIAGSPRRGSNTDLLLEQALKGAADQGAETSLIYAANLNIMPCNHCDGCMYSGKCQFQDDMQKVYTELEKAERIILAAPLHFMGLPGQLKNLIDRAQALWARKYRLQVPPLGDKRERLGWFICVGGRSGERLFEPAQATVKAFFACMDVKYAGMTAFPSIDGRAEILQHPEALQQAYLAGQNLVKASDTEKAG